MGKKKRVQVSKESFRPVVAGSGPGSFERIDPTVLAAILEADFPLVDPSVVHALVSDYEPETLHLHETVIRDQLGILEATSIPDADFDNGASAAPPGAATPTMTSSEASMGRLSPTLNGYSSLSTYTATSVVSTSTSVMSDDGSEPETEYDLLAALFKHLPQRSIMEALDQGTLPAAIDYLLSVEMIRGVQRSGVWPDEPPEEDDESTWETMQRPRSASPTKYTPTPSVSSSGSTSKASVRSKSKKKRPPTVTIPLVDTLQRRSPLSSRAASPTTDRPLVPNDLWTAFTSLAETLSSLVRRAPATYFLSYLHSPDYSCAHDAVLAALKGLPPSKSPGAAADAVTILESMYGNEGDSDNPLSACISATNGEVSYVMDLMDMIEELTLWPDYEEVRENESDPLARLAELDAALPARTPRRAQSTPVVSRPITADRLTRPQPAVKTKAAKAKARVVPGSQASVSYPTAHDSTGAGSSLSVRNGARARPTAPINWQTVAPARKKRQQLHRLASHIPAYGRGMLPHDQRPGALHEAERAESSTLTVAECYARSEREWQRRADAMREAGRHFKSGGRRDVSASVAGHYASRARAHADKARGWELEAGRMVIDSQMARDPNQVDLHYATIDQAVTLAAAAADRWWTHAQASAKANGPGQTPGTFQPLRLVTGKGHHSAGQVGVLTPAVAKALADMGWKVDRREGYVLVRGK